jgi:UPF0755 protein
VAADDDEDVDGFGNLGAVVPARHAAPRTRLTKRGRRTIIGVVVLVLVAILVVGGVAAARVFGGGGGGDADYAGAGTGRVVVQVRSGDSTTAIGTTLLADGVVKSVGAFVSAATANARGGDIQPGYYALHSQMSGAAAVTLLLTPSAVIQSRFTIPEGTSISHVPAIISKGTGIPVAKIQAAIADPASLGLPSYAAGHVEGFLFPATYDVPPGSTATDVLRLMTARFAQAATSTDLVAGAAALKLTPLQVVTIASIIQRESASGVDAPKVARVFYNRIADGMPLGSEFTVAYTGNDAASPYNTYTHTGIPPGPYDSPGQAVLQSALHPAAGTYLFFVTLPQEGTEFVDTEDQFFALQAKCRDEGGCNS